MNHAVKQILLDCLLCVEVEPQPDEDTDETFFKQDSLCYVDSEGKITHDITPPILVGDTVYKGEEWFEDTEGVFYTKAQFDGVANEEWEYKSPETMPIELADKTFKVIGIEVEEQKEYKDVGDNHTIIKKWFWSYKLEEIE